MSYFLHLSTFFFIYAILGVSLNLVVGFTGLVSIMHAAFFGIGAYITAILMVKLGMNFFVALILAILLNTFVGFCLGWLLSRLGGDYYVLGSIAFNFLVLSVFINWENLTSGPLGIPGIPKPELFGFSFSDPNQFFLLSLIFLALVYLASRYIANSSFGRVLKAIREDETAAKVFGYNVLSYKIAVSGFAAGMAAVAGALFSSYLTFIDPTSFDVMQSVFIFSIVIVGGFANLKGSLMGALILILFPEALRFAGFPADISAYAQQAVYGLALILLMIYRPQGILGEYRF